MYKIIHRVKKIKAIILLIILIFISLCLRNLTSITNKDIDSNNAVLIKENEFQHILNNKKNLIGITVNQSSKAGNDIVVNEVDKNNKVENNEVGNNKVGNEKKENNKIGNDNEENNKIGNDDSKENNILSGIYN